MYGTNAATPLPAQDIFGSSFTGIGVSFVNNGSRIDAIRVSNDSDAFRKVVSAVESENGTVITVR